MTDDLGNFDSEMKRVERLSALQRHAEAVALLNDIVSQYPGRFEPYFQRAMSKHSSGDPTGALADLTDAIALNPNEPASFFFRGRWQVERGATEDGIMDLRRAIVADEAHGSSYYADSATALDSGGIFS